MAKMTKSQRDRVREVSRRDYYDVVSGVVNEDGTMTRRLLTASTGRIKAEDSFTRRGRLI